MRRQARSLKTPNVLRDFHSNDSGAVAITFALLATVLFGMVALAVDWSTVIRSRQAVQSKVDLAVLAAARVFADNSGNPTATAQSYFDSQWVRFHLNADPTLIVETTRDGATGDHVVKLTARAEVKTHFAKVIGVDQVAIESNAEARVALPFTEIALALDTTGSMDGSKLADLKIAAKRLIEDIYNIPSARDRVKVSLVPFAQYVNVGLGYRNEPWMDVPPDGTYFDANICWDDRPIVSQTNCRQSTCTSWADGIPTQYACQQCDIVYGPPQRRCGATVTNVWNGCAGSRNYPMNMTPIANAGSRIPGIPNVQCGAPLMRLTDNYNQITNAIDTMTAVGETYITAGVEWGWRTLAASGPFGDARPTSGTNGARKIMVLMTDGANTRSPNYPAHEGWDAAQANQLTTEICTKAKDDGVEIFAVAFDVNDNTIKAILQQCANRVSNYYETDTRSDLYAAFETIARQLVQTRLTK